MNVDAVFNRQRTRALTLRVSTADERLARLRGLERAVLARQRDIYAAVAADLRKSEAEADLTEIMPILSEIRHARRHLKSWMTPKRVPPSLAMIGTRASVRHEPKGVSLIISPWNYPFNLTFGPLVSAVAAGCTAIIKPSELTPHSAAVLADIVRDAFAPDDVALFAGDATVATALLDLPFDHIFFTGSPEIGSIVMAAAAKHLSSVTLELGGKSPVIVDRSADLRKAARSVVWAKFANCGQTCIAPDYAFVHASVMPQFIEVARTAIADMYGDAATSADYCRIVTPRHFERIKGLIDDAKTGGATVLAGGGSDAAQKYIAPTLLSGVADSARIMREEIFGPVLPIVPFDAIEAPISAINARPKPLALYVYASDKTVSDRVIAETSAGGSCVNASMTHFLHVNLPFGGVNHSGIGNAHGYYGFRAFSHERAILTDRFGATPMLFPPYNRRVREMIKMTVKFFT